MSVTSTYGISRASYPAGSPVLSKVDDQSQEPRWDWPRVFLQDLCGRQAGGLSQVITLTDDGRLIGYDG